MEDERRRRPEPAGVVEERPRAEALEECDRAAGEQHRVGDAGAGGVEHRQRLQEAVLLADVWLQEDAVIIPEGGVRGTDAFRRPGRTGRVDEAHIVPRLARAVEGGSLAARAAADLVDRQRPPG